MLGSRWFRVALVGVVASAGAFALSGSEPLERAEGTLVDERFDRRGAQAPPSGVALVGINEDSFDALRTRWPFPRRLHARAIEHLLEAGARAVAYDVQFTEPSRPADDRALLRAAADPRVVLGTAKLNARYEPVVLGGADALRRRGGQVGVVYFPTDADGVWRRMERAIEGVPHMATLAARAAGAAVDRDAAPVDFAGPANTIPELRFSDVVRGRFDRAAVDGKVVVVGATAPSLLDRHATAAGPEMPGPEVMANAIATILDDYPLRDAPWAVGALLVVLAAVAPALATLRGPPWRALLQALLAGALGAVALLAGGQLAFDGGWIVPLATPLTALALGTVGAVALTYAVEVRARRHLRGEFERFAPAPVVDRLLDEHATSPRLASRRTEATVMFCDLRGFTSLAERLGAEQVIEVLNRYLDVVSDAVFGAGGTVVSYQGDGVMAVFGAPIERDDHAACALATARELVERGLPAFNRWLLAERFADAPMNAGIGLNSGPVMAGIVGSDRRVEFAAVGDATNVAARLQTLGRDHPAHQLFVSGTTYAALRDGDRAALAKLEQVELRGRREPVTVYVLAGRDGG